MIKHGIANMADDDAPRAGSDAQLERTLASWLDIQCKCCSGTCEIATPFSILRCPACDGAGVRPNQELDRRPEAKEKAPPQRG
jgi:hypothetical protein